MIYPPEDGHPSRYKPGPTCVNFVHATNAANHYATPPTFTFLVPAGPGSPGKRAVKRVCVLQALTRQLRAAVAESRGADGLPTNVDDEGTTTAGRDHQGTPTTATNDDDHAVWRLMKSKTNEINTQIADRDRDRYTVFQQKLLSTTLVAV